MKMISTAWAILSTTTKQLKFMYADPTFSRHLSSQANALIGTSFFDYIHPEERERAELDMQNIIQSKTLFGSVTRCRYSRTHRIRSLLGATDPPVPSNCSKLNAEERDYLAIDIVVNWIGDGMALCFFHAIMDESVQDNDEVERTDWSNWCGMQENAFDQEECQIIWQRIKSNRSLTRSPTGPNYVFQILSSVSSQDVSPNVLFSWPPPRLSSVPSTLTDTSTTTSNTNFADGSYCIDDFARLAQGVNLLTLKRELSDANTSCTRRFRAKHTLTTEVMVRSVESVLIPYGSIVLACFSVPYAQVLPGSADAPFSSSSKTVEYPKPEGISSAHVDKKAELSNPSLASLVDASISMAKKEAGGNGNGDSQRSMGEGSGSGSGSVATLAAVAAAAAAQSKQCASCGTSNSPEWRKGPDGSKSLCNACGLRFARNISRAKKREERALMAAEVAANGGIIPPHLRKKLGDLKKPKKKPNKEKQASTSSSTATLPPFPLNPAQHSTNEDDASIQLARAAARAAAAAGLRQS